MSSAQPSVRERVNWPAVAIFYVVACAVSWPFFWWRDMAPESWHRSHLPGLLKTMGYMWGPGVGALVALLAFRGRHRRRITLVGTSWRRSLLFYLGPLALLSVLGGRAMDDVPPHLAGISAAVISFLTIFGEELGWRGFLQDALRPLSRPVRYALIGVLWELWHFTNRTTHKPLLNVVLTLAISYPVLIGLSWIIGEAVERSRSLLVAQALHLWIDLVADLPSWQAFTALGVGVGLWLVLLRSWPQALGYGSGKDRAASSSAA